MKKVLFFLFFFLLFLLNCSSQTLVNTNKLWSNLWQTASGGPLPHIKETKFVKFNEDTLIGSHHFYKVFVATDSLQTGYSKSGFIREDSAKKVYFRSNSDSVERLIYDFNVIVGDTVIIFNGMQQKLAVDTVDSVLIGNQYLKRIVLSSFGWSGEQWIETIGSLCGILSSGSYFMTGTKHDLLCYYKNDTLQFHNPNFSECYYNNVGIQELPNNGLVSIFPNPFIATAQIIFHQTYHNVSLSVYDIQGKLMLQKQYADCNQIQLNRDRLSNGMYFLKLRLDEKEVETAKIVVSD